MPEAISIGTAMHGQRGGTQGPNAATMAAPPTQSQGLYDALESSTPTPSQPQGIYGATMAVPPQMRSTHNQVASEPVLSGPRTSGLLAVHIASFEEETRLAPAWAEASAKHAQVLTGLSPRVEKINLGPTRGIYHRLKAGPVPSRADADRICANIVAMGGFCKVSTFEGEDL